MSELRGPGSGEDQEAYDLSPEEWKDTTDEVADKPEAEPAPEEPAPLISPENADAAVDNKQEREKFSINYVEQAHQRSVEEIAARYKINEGNPLSRFIKQTKAVFAGEYSDLTISKKVAEAKPEEQAKELKKAFRLFGRDGAMRLGKIGAKTGVASGIGAGITAILGGTIGSPVLVGALLGGAAARGAFELYRHMKKDEREGRTKVIESRSKVFAEAAKLQDQAVDLVMEREEADDERKAEIDKQLAELHQYFIDLTHYESYQALYAENKAETQLKGLAETQKLGHEKMRLEKKREKLADLVAAGGSLLGGILGGVVQQNLLNADIDKVRGVWADFDKDGIRHFVEKISPNDILQAEPGFTQQLEKTGGFVFNYNPSEVVNTVGANPTDALLKSKEVVHVLPGLNDTVFRELIKQSNPELAERAAALAGNFWKEAGPIAGAHLLFLAEFFSSAKKGEKETGAESDNKPKNDGEPPALPGIDAKALPMRKKPEGQQGVSDEATNDGLALSPNEAKELPAGDNGKNLPVRWAEKDTTGQEEVLEEVEDDISKAFLEAYNEKGDKKVEPESKASDSIVKDVENLYKFGESELSDDLLRSFGITISKAPAPDGRAVTSIVLKDKNDFVQSIKLEYQEPEYDREGRPLPNRPRIVIGRTDKREEDGWKTITNPSNKEVTALLNNIVDRFEDANAKKHLQKEEPVPITINGQTNSQVSSETKKAVEVSENKVDFEDIAEGDTLFLRVPEQDSSRIGQTVIKSGKNENGLIKITVDRIDKKRQVIVTKVGKIPQPFTYSTIESMVVGRNLESQQAEETTEAVEESPTEEQATQLTETPPEIDEPVNILEQELEAEQPEPDKELYDLITEAGKDAGDFAEGQPISFSESANDSEEATEIKEALNVPRSQKLSDIETSILITEGVGEPEATDFNITLMREEGGQQYDYTISLRKLIPLIK